MNSINPTKSCKSRNIKPVIEANRGNTVTLLCDHFNSLFPEFEDCLKARVFIMISNSSDVKEDLRRFKHVVFTMRLKSVWKRTLTSSFTWLIVLTENMITERDYILVFCWFYWESLFLLQRGKKNLQKAWKFLRWRYRRAENSLRDC